MRMRVAKNNAENLVKIGQSADLPSLFGLFREPIRASFYVNQMIMQMGIATL